MFYKFSVNAKGTSRFVVLDCKGNEKYEMDYFSDNEGRNFDGFKNEITFYNNHKGVLNSIVMNSWGALLVSEKIHNHLQKYKEEFDSFKVKVDYENNLYDYYLIRAKAREVIPSKYLYIAGEITIARQDIIDENLCSDYNIFKPKYSTRFWVISEKLYNELRELTGECLPFVPAETVASLEKKHKRLEELKKIMIKRKEIEIDYYSTTQDKFEVVLNKWLNNIANEEKPNYVVALNFNLYENMDGTHTIECIGSNEFDAEDDEWACCEVYIHKTAITLSSNIKNQEFKKLAQTIIKNYIKTGELKEEFMKFDGIGIGFTDGSVSKIYKKKQKISKTENQLEL